MKENIYDNLSEEEEMVLKMAEKGFSNWQMAMGLNMSYGSLTVLKSKMRQKGIYIKSNKTIFTDEYGEKIKKLNSEGKTDLEISQILKVKYATIASWKLKMRSEGVVFKNNRGRNNVDKGGLED